MNSSLIQLFVLAGIAIFLIIKLRAVFGTREGFEKSSVLLEHVPRPSCDVELIEDGLDRDITDNVPEDSSAARALTAMKVVEPAFSVVSFLSGARGAYEMILMAFNKGDLDSVCPFIDVDVKNSFSEAIKIRQEQGLTVESKFVGMRELTLHDASYNIITCEAEISVRFVSEIISVVKNAAGEIVEGKPNEIKRQRDVWTFTRKMGSKDLNWQLVATGE